MIAEILLPWQFFELDFMLRNHENLPCNPTHLTHKRKIPGTYRRISSLVCIIMQENTIPLVQFFRRYHHPEILSNRKKWSDWINSFISLIYKPTFCGEWASDAVRIGTLHFTIDYGIPGRYGYVPRSKFRLYFFLQHT